MSERLRSEAEKITDEWRRQRAAPLIECQASFTDGECVHKKCPVPRGDQKCPLPWERYFDGL